jgi:hypothetical protein
LEEEVRKRKCGREGVEHKEWNRRSGRERVENKERKRKNERERRDSYQLREGEVKRGELCTLEKNKEND